MTMPSRKRRNMRVAGVSYHYIVKRKGDAYSVTIQNVKTNELKFISHTCPAWFVVKPGHVKAMILAGDDDHWEHYLERKVCKCGNGIGTAVKNMCVFDAEIRRDGIAPHYCNCCDECRSRCADDI